MTDSKVKLYDEERHFIGESSVNVPAYVKVIAFGNEHFIRSEDHPNSFVLTSSVTLKNGEVSW